RVWTVVRGRWVAWRPMWAAVGQDRTCPRTDARCDGELRHRAGPARADRASCAAPRLAGEPVTTRQRARPERRRRTSGRLRRRTRLRPPAQLREMPATP